MVDITDEGSLETFSTTLPAEQDDPNFSVSTEFPVSPSGLPENQFVEEESNLAKQSNLQNFFTDRIFE